MNEWHGARFADTAVLITGGAHGIGRACVTRLAQEGARLVIADLDLNAATETVESLEGGRARGHVAIRMDVTVASSVQSAVDEAAERLGGLDVLINVAGGDTDSGDFDETDDEVWSRMFELNLLSVARTCRAAVPHLRRGRKSPAIVTVTSINGLTALGSEPYSAAKAGVGSLTANLALSLAKDRIRVNAVAPATIRTRVWDAQEGGADRLRVLYPLDRIGEPDDVAAAVAFLASTDAAWITGHTIPVDGGLLAGHALP